MNVIENGLVPVYEGDAGSRLVDARELHEFLDVGRDFATWLQERVRKYGFSEGADFSPKPGKSSGGRPTAEYWLTMGTAKELAMVENNERGKQVRRYFIAVEERARELAAAPAPQFRIPKTYPEALRLAAEQAETIEKQQAAIQVMAPKADFHDRVADAVNCEEIGEFAKVLGTGQNRFFKWLREQKILMENNHPYQQHLDAGHFKVEERTRVDKHKQQRTYFVTVITGKGQTYLHRRWAQAGNGMQMKLEAPSTDERLLN